MDKSFLGFQPLIPNSEDISPNQTDPENSDSRSYDSQNTNNSKMQSGNAADVEVKQKMEEHEEGSDKIDTNDTKISDENGRVNESEKTAKENGSDHEDEVLEEIMDVKVEHVKEEEGNLVVDVLTDDASGTDNSSIKTELAEEDNMCEVSNSSSADSTTTGRAKRSVKPKKDSDFLCGDEIEEGSPLKREEHIYSKGFGHVGRGKNRYFDPNGSIMAEKLSKPFEQGWRRELVIRGSVPDDGDSLQKSRKPMDVYYHSPVGKKLRSLVEITKYLVQHRSELTPDNFSFTQQQIYKEPGEIVRSAGLVGVSVGISPRRGKGRPPGKLTPTKVSLSSPKELSQAYSPSSGYAPSVRRGRPPAVKTDKQTASFIEAQKIVQGNVSFYPEFLDSFEIEIVGDNEAEEYDIENLRESIFQEPSDENEISLTKKRPANTLPVREKPGPKRFKKFYQDDPTSMRSTQDESMAADTPLLFCGMDCVGQEGKPPSLCCDICLSMFHPACVNYNSLSVPDKFTCKNCNRFNLEHEPAGSRENVNPQKVPPGPVPVSLTPNKSLMAQGYKQRNPIQFIKVLPQTNSSTVVLPASSYNSTKPLQTSVQQTVRTMVPSVTPSQTATKPVPVNLLKNSASSSGVVLVPPSQLQQAVTSSAPPQLKAVPSQRGHAPGQTAQTPAAKAPASMNQQTGQLLTFPPNVMKRLNMQQPLAIKLNNKTLLVSPSCFLPTVDGMKVYLPADSLPSDSTLGSDISISQGQTSIISAGKQVIVSTSTRNGAESRSNSESPSSVGALQSVVPTAVSDTKSSSPAVWTTQNITMITPPDASAQTTCKSRPGPRSKTSVTKSSSVCHLQAFHSRYDCLFSIFRYLSVADRLRASCVCRTWRNLVANNLLWREISLKNMRVSDWECAVKSMNRYGTESLDMRGLVHFEDRNRTWQLFTAALSKLRSVNQLLLGQCPALVVYAVAVRLPNLEVLSAEWITNSTNKATVRNAVTQIDVTKLAHMRELHKLRLKGVAGLTMPEFSFTGVLSELSVLRQLRHLSITTLKNVPATEFSFLNSLENLQSLEVGEINNWTSETYASLGNLTNLRHLRLEYGGQLEDIGLGDALHKLKKLVSLELIMMKIPCTLTNALSEMKQLKSLSVWPDISKQAATVNSNTLNTLSVLTQLKTLDWGITADEQTSIIVDDDIACIPFSTTKEQNESNDSQTQSEEYISTNQLFNKLSSHLKDTKVKVSRVSTTSANMVTTDV